MGDIPSIPNIKVSEHFKGMIIVVEIGPKGGLSPSIVTNTGVIPTIMMGALYGMAQAALSQSTEDSRDSAGKNVKEFNEGRIAGLQAKIDLVEGNLQQFDAADLSDPMEDRIHG